LKCYYINQKPFQKSTFILAEQPIRDRPPKVTFRCENPQSPTSNPTPHTPNPHPSTPFLYSPAHILSFDEASRYWVLTLKKFFFDFVHKNHFGGVCRDENCLLWVSVSARRPFWISSFQNAGWWANRMLWFTHWWFFFCFILKRIVFCLFIACDFEMNFLVCKLEFFYSLFPLKNLSKLLILSSFREASDGRIAILQASQPICKNWAKSGKNWKCPVQDLDCLTGSCWIVQNADRRWQRLIWGLFVGLNGRKAV